jgi:hypothetical protein
MQRIDEYLLLLPSLSILFLMCVRPPIKFYLSFLGTYIMTTNVFRFPSVYEQVLATVLKSSFPADDSSFSKSFGQPSAACIRGNNRQLTCRRSTLLTLRFHFTHIGRTAGSRPGPVLSKEDPGQCEDGERREREKKSEVEKK